MQEERRGRERAVTVRAVQNKARPGGPERSSGQKRVGLNQQCGVAEIGGAGKGNHAVGGWGKVGGVAIERSKGIGQKSIRHRGKQLHGGKLKQRNFWKRGIYFVGGDGFVAATRERAERFLVAVLCCWFGGNPAGGAGGSINFTTRCGFAFHPAGMKRHRHAKRVEQKRQKRQCYGNRAEHWLSCGKRTPIDATAQIDIATKRSISRFFALLLMHCVTVGFGTMRGCCFVCWIAASFLSLQSTSIQTYHDDT